MDQNDIPVIPSDWAFPKPYKMTVELNDGTIIEGYARKSSIDDTVWVFITDPDYGYLKLVTTFTDPEKTAVIQSHASELDHVTYEGYTRLASINSDMNGKFSIGMTKPI